VHVPAWQVSVCVQAFASLQTDPVRGAQVPFAAAPAAMLQAWQSFATPPPHAVLQQTPSAQKPLTQSEFIAHVPPCVWLST
jgi:hypothetical protein